MNLPGISRKTVGDRLGVGERQVRRLLKLAAKHLELFADFIDSETGTLNGTPIETEEQIQALRTVRLLLHKYKNTKNKAEIIVSELDKINRADNHRMN
ncbi:MAG: hypothetical protein ACKO9U_05920 [Dolichospermum sp.]